MSVRPSFACGFPAAHLIAAASTTFALLYAAPVAAHVAETELTSIHTRAASVMCDFDTVRTADGSPNDVLHGQLAATFEQHTRGGGGGGGGTQGSGGGGCGTAVPRGGGSAGGGTTHGGSSSGGTASGGSSSGGGSGADSKGGSGQTSAGAGTSGGSSGTATARTRDGQPAEGRAVPRPGGPIVPGGGGYYGGYYPWGWGSLGLWGYYGFYDPWWYGPYPPVDGYYASEGGHEGSLKLKVRPRDAKVYVDSYYAGVVDDFDGTFQSLKLDAGPHRIEISLDGYEALSFEVNVWPDRTTTYKAEMKKLEP